MTYLEAENGKDETVTYTGRRFTQRGSADDKDAVVWQLVADDGTVFNFLVSKEGTSLTLLNDKFEAAERIELYASVGAVMNRASCPIKTESLFPVFIQPLSSETTVSEVSPLYCSATQGRSVNAFMTNVLNSTNDPMTAFSPSFLRN